jgi:biopolymer transport protein ExbD
MKKTPHTKHRDYKLFPTPYRGKRSYARSPFSPVAFLDLCLLFVLFFITIQNSQIVIWPGINLKLPNSEFRAGTHYNKFDTILITLSREGMVFFNDELTTLDGLEPSIARASHEHPDMSMLIQADFRIDYGTIVDIFNMGARAGIKNITMATSISPEKVSEP